MRRISGLVSVTAPVIVPDHLQVPKADVIPIRRVAA
jgi:hypothetical protein